MFKWSTRIGADARYRRAWAKKLEQRRAPFLLNYASSFIVAREARYASFACQFGDKTTQTNPLQDTGDEGMLAFQ